MSMKHNRWQLHRAGLLNFWYYDEEEFEFADGKLLLRGANGSGKSVTMQSLITVLLDGRKSPDRLDPFGSKARRMEDYLLGEKEVVDRDERTGYLYLEYKRKNSEQYITTGIGLRAKRHGNLDFWGFVITDNRRIGHHIKLYTTEINPETGQAEKIPLSRKQLENRLEQGGQVVTTQREYMALVNKHVFGFETLEAYDELMKLLIQLRSPKLSREFKPTVIYEILNDALPALTDDELRPLSDTIEHMDQTKQQLDQLIRDEKAVTRLCKQYDQYNEFVLSEKAGAYIAAYTRVEQLKATSDKILEYMTELSQRSEALTLEISQLKQEQKVLEQEYVQLESQDVFKRERELLQLKEQYARYRQELQQKEQLLAQKKKREREMVQQLQNLEREISECEKSMDERAELLDFDAAEAMFDAHAIARAEWLRSREEGYSFLVWKQDANQYMDRLEGTLRKLREQTRALERYKEYDNELAEVRRQLDMHAAEMEKWRTLFEEEREGLLAALHDWHSTNRCLKLSDEQLHETARRINRLIEDYTADQLHEPARQAYQSIQRDIAERIASLKQEIKNLEEELLRKQSELNDWKEKKDPEPERHPDTEETRRRLTEQGIPYVPFFAAVEFADHVDDADKERLEAALSAMGILDALIIPEKMQMQIHPENDRILRPQPKLFGHTLADWLEPATDEQCAVSGEDITNILMSITLTEDAEGAVSIDETGRYQIGLIRGHAPFQREARFIGRIARRRYRQQQIERLQEECAALLQEQQQVRTALHEEQARMQMLEEELRRFPSIKPVEDAYDLWKTAQRQVIFYEQEAGRKHEQVREAASRLQAIRAELVELTRHISLEIKEEVYEEAYRLMKTYMSNLNTLELLSNNYGNLHKQYAQIEEHREEVQFDVDQLKGECRVLEDQLAACRSSMDVLDKLLQDMGVEEIRKRIEEVLRRLKVLPDQINDCTGQLASAQKELEHLQEQAAGLSREMALAEHLLKLWQQSYQEEERLRFLPGQGAEDHLAPSSQTADGEVGDASGYGSGDVYVEQETLLERARAWAERQMSDTDRERLTNQLTAAFYEAQRVLIEYRMMMDSSDVQTQPEGLNEVPDTYRILYEEWQQKSRRVYIYMEYEGKKVSPYYMKNQLEQDIERQKLYLQEKDRELFEEIIFNSVGRMIRARIGRAERWVEQINRLMDERDTSSGLKFSIRWKPKTAEREEEMDTEDLVKLLRTDARLLRDEDMQRITRHFRSKVNQAKELIEDNAYGETLHQVIRDMLDYRKWFSFTLYYRRQGEPRKELTNHVFYTLSGGEKAMAMYIPLFCAAYSRYMEARDDAPYIISLDEAFAGVDENNIRDMFDLVEKLGFNYIMNSQALWGDYDTVSALSICELVRPKNAPYVTVVRYYWNGIERKPLQDAQLEAAAAMERMEQDMHIDGDGKD